MARGALQRLAASALDRARGPGSARYLDRQLELRVHGTEERLLAVGGRWDRKTKRYVGPAKSAIVIYAAPSQVVAARWFATWLRHYLAGAHPAGCDCAGIWSALFGGPRRSGKTRLAAVCVLLFVTAVRGGMVWCVSPTQEETQELEDVIEELLPASWYTWSETSQRYTFTSGARVWMRSAYKPRALKRGRVDLAVINEAQNQSQAVYAVIRPATADTGGLTILAANPPDDPAGEWVEEYRTAANGGAIAARSFDFDPLLNPFVEHASLAALEKELDPITFRREIRGEWGIPLGNRVWHQFSDQPLLGHILEAGTHPADRHLPLAERRRLKDVTEEFTRRVLGRPFAIYGGADFQLEPHMVWLARRAFEDPDATGEVLLWTVDEVIVEDATEDELIDAVIAGGYTKEIVGTVGDASGDWQNAERTKGRGSFDVFRRRGFHIYPPDPGGSTRNPDVNETIKVGNARLRSADGRIHEYVDPRCVETIWMMKKWPRKNGTADKGSKYAHRGDAWRYPLWRAFPRRLAVSTKVEYQAIDRGRTARRDQLDGSSTDDED